MKVLFINSVCGIRSTGRICTDLAMAFEKDGHECKIAYGRETVPEKYVKYAVKIGTDIGVKTQVAQSRLLDNVGFTGKKSTAKFLEWADKYNPDLLWLHNLHGYYINIEMLFEWIKMRPDMQVKWTLHDCWAFTGHCTYFSMIGCEKWKSHCFDCPQTKEYPTSYFVSRCKSNYDRKKKAFTGVNNMELITPSKWLANLAKESFLGEYPVEVRYNTIDTNIFKPRESDFRSKYGLGNKKIILGVAAIWDKRKGLEDFIRLSGMLDKNKYHIVVVGVTDNQLKGLPEGILGIQRTNNAIELAEIYTAADVFINTTYEDNYPTVNLEAKACGTPVITYNTGGSVESVDSDKIVEQGDLEAVCELIERII